MAQTPIVNTPLQQEKVSKRIIHIHKKLIYGQPNKNKKIDERKEELI